MTPDTTSAAESDKPMNTAGHDSETARLLAEYVAARDVTCPRCGYNLRGVTSGRCPECGDGLTIRIGLLEPRMAAYVAMIVGASLGLGGGGLFGLVALFEAPRSWWESSCGAALLGLFVIGAVILPLLLVGRRRIRRRSRRVQWCIAVGIWLVMIALSVVVLVTFDG